MRGIQVAPAVLCVALLFVSTLACQTKTPEEQIADLRASYTATVNQGGFVAKARFAEPVIEELVEGEEGDDGEAMAEPAVDESLVDESGMNEPIVDEPVSYDITLDILVSTDSRQMLPSLTVDIVHLNGDEVEKQRWPVNLDTSRIVQGPGAQIVHTLEEVAYEAGDIFYTEVRHPIPAEERGNYPEFATAP